MLATLTSSAVIDVAVVVALRMSVSELPGPLLLKGSEEGRFGKVMYDAGSHRPAPSCGVSELAATAPAVVDA